jgi:cytochrome P450 family 710 subfamily A protein
LVRDAFNYLTIFRLTQGAKTVFGENNIAFMTGDPHKVLRKRLLPLFTPRALSVFLQVQEKTIRKHLKQWIAS